jgi:hypothetical protein
MDDNLTSYLSFKKMSQIKGLTGIGVYLWLCALSFGWRKKMVKIKG